MSLNAQKCSLKVMIVVHSPHPNRAKNPSLSANYEHLAGLRPDAALETFKGVLAVIASFALFTLLHKDIGDIAENVIEFLHLNPAHHFVQAFINVADRISDRKIVGVACVGFAYALIRFVEAYGLWNARAWAQWFAIISGSAYLPLEIVAIVRHPNALHWAVLIVNILVVVYMIYVRWDVLRQRDVRLTSPRIQPNAS